jgi:hypothetical protein
MAPEDRDKDTNEAPGDVLGLGRTVIQKDDDIETVPVTDEDSISHSDEEIARERVSRPKPDPNPIGRPDSPDKIGVQD